MEVIFSLQSGINVGSTTKVKMEALRGLHEAAGCLDVSSYIQTGNILFKHPGGDLKGLQVDLEARFESAFGFHSDFFLIPLTRLESIRVASPFTPDSGWVAKLIHVIFLAQEPDAASFAALNARCQGEEVVLKGDVLYIYYGEGSARSKIGSPDIKRVLRQPCTGRNWNTVHKLLNLAPHP